MRNKKPSLKYYSLNPDTSFDIINKYGTFEIQPTADTDNPFPHISQGLPSVHNRKKRKEESTVREDAF